MAEESVALEPVRLKRWEQNYARWFAARVATRVSVTRQEETEKASQLAGHGVSWKHVRLLRRSDVWQQLYQEAQTRVVEAAESDAKAALRATAPLAVKVYRKALGALHKELATGDAMSAARSAAPLLNIGIDRLSPRKTEHAITQTTVTITLSAEQQKQIAAPEITVEATEVEILSEEPT